MLFNTWGYLVFLVAAIGLHWILPHNRWRIYSIVAFSMIFYCMWRWEFSLLMVFSSFVDFTCSRRIYSSSNQSERKVFLLISLIINLGLLVVFKYTYFIYDNIRIFTGAFGYDLRSLEELGIKIILPLGISFYTFQTISYTIDVYRKVIKPVSDFPVFLAYVTFWPQLIAGPILRAGEVIPQLSKNRFFSWSEVSSGLALIVTGLFKKVMIADNLGPMVDLWFAYDVNTLTAIDVWVANFLFGFQIYFDFSAYSDIAIGSALLVGLHFPDNFNWPYMALSPKDFWKRWHISLSSWIRDYLYLPLSGQTFRTESTGGISVATQTGSAKKIAPLLITWFIMGLWHGANWTFACWGIYHAAIILLYRRVNAFQQLPEKAPVIAWLTMLLFAMAGWIPFRATSLDQAAIMFTKILNPFEYTISHRILGMSSQLAGFSYLWAFGITFGMVLFYVTRRYWLHRPAFKLVNVPFQTVLIAVMVCAILACMRVVRQFIYFQF